MKHLNIFILASLLIGLSMTSCQEVKKQKEKVEEVIKTEDKTVVSFDTENVLIEWTAYKTTDKKAVEGKFETVTITNIKESSDKIEALNGVEFEIPVSSLFSNNEERDSKLKELFFGAMDNTLSLKGTLTFDENGEGKISLTMNGVQAEIPIKYGDTDNSVSILGVLDLENWNAQAAVSSLNEACKDLHAGEDGVSKTWNEVKIRATIKTK